MKTKNKSTDRIIVSFFILLLIIVSTFNNPLSAKAIEENGEVTGMKNMEEVESNAEEVINQGMSLYPSIYEAPSSINDIIAVGDQSAVAIIPGTDGSSYQTYSGNETGLKAALFELYQNGNSDKDYVIYIGTNITASTTAGHIGSKAIPATLTASNITFSSLEGKINTLAITSSITDPTTSTTTAPEDAKTFSLSTNVFMGSNIILRNINYNFNSLYFQGYNGTLGNGSYDTMGGLSVYGGTEDADVIGNPMIEVHSTGNAAFSFYGANSNGGTLTGNPSINIYNTSNSITNLYGGALTGHIIGNVATTVSRMQGVLSTYAGGSRTGNISGSITNSLSGAGSLSGASVFFGGSYNGDIGSDLTLGKDVITTVFDSSNYIGGSFTFAGGNDYSGTIKGNIINKVTAGSSATTGGIRALFGGGSINISQPIRPTNAQIDALQLSERAPYFEARSNFKIYGNITTEATKGFIGTTAEVGWTRGAGYAGYIQGDVRITLGTEGRCYGGASYNVSMEHSTTNRNRGNATGFDIVGGGGMVADINNIYIKGSTTLIQKNVLARWTYGAGFGGLIEGNTRNELHEGVVDTLEGGGFNTSRIYGNTSAYVKNGQVDWFLTGGGWNDWRIEGNASVEVVGGTINASMGGTYGASATHTVTGNATIHVTGGNFSGMPRTGSPGFSGGATEAGAVLGNTKVTLDLRNSQEGFKLPSNTSISGGRRIGAATTLGTNTNNTIELNIYTNPESDVLAGANIYGDGGTAAANTRSGSIKINIDAPGSTIGNFYATQYSNISGSSVLRNVEFNIANAKTINGISGGSSGDDFTNTTFDTTTNKSVVINFGSDKAENTDTIDISGTGIVNFFELNINKIMLRAIGNGSIKNGRSATATNHGTTYSKFGNIAIRNGGGLGITNDASAIISGGELSINGESILRTPSGAGLVNITSFKTTTSADRLNWIRTNGLAPVPSTGTWFGAQGAYQVLTFTPDASKASAITPDNFIGVDGISQKSYLGDNDITKASGYGLAIPGSVIDFEVIEGKGTIMHNMDGVSEGPPPPSVEVYGSVEKNTPVTKGRLAIPLSSGLPKLTFTPDGPSESWIKEVKITRSDGQVETITESSNFDPVEWVSSDGEYSYKIAVKYTDTSELAAKHAIITETEAAEITSASNIQNYNQAKGRPFFTDTIDQTLMDAIKVPLSEDQLFRIHSITYTAGPSEDLSKYLVQTVNIIVVRDGAVFPADVKDRSHVLFAQDADMSLNEANSLADQNELDTSYTKAIGLYGDGTIAVATIDNTAISAIQGAFEATDVSVTYTFEGLEKKVTVHILDNGVPFAFYKVDVKNHEVVLQGAEFTMYTCDNSTVGHTHDTVVTEEVIGRGDCWKQARDSLNQTLIVTSTVEGQVDFGVLPNGNYMLVETKAPEGYERPVGQWLLVVNSEQTGSDKIVITAKGAILPPAFLRDGANKLLLPNMRGFPIPTSGADGILPFIVVGISLILGAGIIFILRKKNIFRKRGSIL